MSGSDHIPGSLPKLLALGLLLPFGSMAAIANARKSQPDLYAAHGHLMCSILIHTIGTILAALEQEPHHAHLCPYTVSSTVLSTDAVNIYLLSDWVRPSRWAI